MIGASTRLLDCWDPQLEFIRLPAIRWPAWDAAVAIRIGSTSEVSGRRYQMPWRRSSAQIELEPQTAAIDLRPLGGGNIAHAMISGVVRFSVARQAMIRSGFNGRLIAILPVDVVPYVLDLYRLFEIQVLQTDSTVVGRIVEVQLVGEQSIRLAADLLPTSLNTALSSEGIELPSRVFLARRGARSIENLGEVERMMERRGFITVYPEQLSVLDQLKLLWQAEEVVGVHGAALALLLVRAVQRPRHPLRVVEVFGPGYVTSLYRCLAAELGAAWAGVRGRVTPEAVQDLEIRGPASLRYRLGTRLRGLVPASLLPPDDAWQRAHQMSSFNVDARALSEAIESVRDPSYKLPERVWASL